MIIWNTFAIGERQQSQRLSFGSVDFVVLWRTSCRRLLFPVRVFIDGLHCHALQTNDVVQYERTDESPQWSLVDAAIWAPIQASVRFDCNAKWMSRMLYSMNRSLASPLHYYQQKWFCVRTFEKWKRKPKRKIMKENTQKINAAIDAMHGREKLKLMALRLTRKIVFLLIAFRWM